MSGGIPDPGHPEALSLGGAVGTLTRGHAHRLVRGLRGAVDRLEVDLGGLTVATEAATGYFAALPVMAAAAGATVWAVPAENQFGTTEEGVLAVKTFASLVGGDAGGIEFCSRESLPLESVDVVTNSQSLRPIDEAIIGSLSSEAVVTLMYESWELRPEDVDLAMCLDRDIRVVGVDEHHPLVDSFRYCGPLLVKMLHSAGVTVLGSTIVILGSDPFADVCASALVEFGADLVMAPDLASAQPSSAVDALVHTDLVAHPDVGSRDGWESISSTSPGAVVVQFTGGLPGVVIRDLGLDLFPSDVVPPRTMGWSLAGLGPDPLFRLFAGALKAAEEAHWPEGVIGVGQPVTALSDAV